MSQGSKRPSSWPPEGDTVWVGYLPCGMGCCLYQELRGLLLGLATEVSWSLTFRGLGGGFGSCPGTPPCWASGGPAPAGV